VAPPISEPPIDPGLIEEILARIHRQIEQQRLPVSTYRLQFTGELTFAKAADCVEYLHELGITDLYASPLFQAREHTQSGYDVADCSRLNEDLGTAEDFERSPPPAARWVDSRHRAQLRRPRRRGIAGARCAGERTAVALRDLLRHRLDAVKPDLANKILLSTLGDQYGGPESGRNQQEEAPSR
jgi:hypothetical protein